MSQGKLLNKMMLCGNFLRNRQRLKVIKISMTDDVKLLTFQVHKDARVVQKSCRMYYMNTSLY